MSRKVKNGSRVQRRAMTKSPMHKFCQGRSRRMVRLASKELGTRVTATVAVKPVVTSICSSVLDAVKNARAGRITQV